MKHRILDWIATVIQKFLGSINGRRIQCWSHLQRQFLYLCIWEDRRGFEREPSLLLDHSCNTQNSWVWIRLNRVLGNSVQVYNMGSRNALVEPLLLPLQGCISGKLGSATKIQHSSIHKKNLWNDNIFMLPWTKKHGSNSALSGQMIQHSMRPALNRKHYFKMFCLFSAVLWWSSHTLLEGT